ncbi:unnamed protein product [Pseudo-nitzschia multistriata]|uniref:Helicase-associated domain-containing protein n=1 Tax=Pseudo-nitzschia multistriata TaxID=183589 RepID=A0A448YWD5_9STRA|nr:unnamed protein product [Pseudo-nitzschia multistriata]
MIKVSKGISISTATKLTEDINQSHPENAGSSSSSSRTKNVSQKPSVVPSSLTKVVKAPHRNTATKPTEDGDNPDSKSVGLSNSNPSAKDSCQEKDSSRTSNDTIMETSKKSRPLCKQKQTSFVAKWEHMFEQLVEYKKKHNHTLLPRDCKTNPKLGRWVAIQRRMHAENSLLVERKSKLDSIGLSWDRRPRQSALWNRMYKSLLRFKAKHNNTLVPQGEGKLGRWVHAQRVAYKNKTLSQERIALLQTIGFVWDVHGMANEQKVFTELQRISRLSMASLLAEHASTNCLPLT